MRELSVDALSLLKGGMRLAEAVDWGCGAVGVWGAFGGPVTLSLGLFCAGWGIGRLLG
jgi:hypothetical protein